MNAPTELELRKLLYLLPVGVVQFDAAGRVLIATPRVVQLLLPVVGAGAMRDAFALLAPLLPDLPSLLHKEADAVELAVGRRRLVDPGGRAIVAEVHLHRTDETFTAVVLDITAQAEAQRQIRREERRFRTIVQAVHGYAIYSVDEAGVIDSWNDSAQRVFGMTDAVGSPLQALLPLDTPVETLLRAAQKVGWATAGCWLEAGGADPMWLETHISPLEPEETGAPQEGFVVVTRDRTAERLRSEELMEAAHRDPLTNLANRRCFEQRHAEVMADGPAAHAILMLDLDHFKAVNDTHGHDVGDAVLVAVAGALEACARGDDFPGRLGGEEFAVLLPGTDLEGARRAGERVRSAIAALVLPLADGGTLRVTSSVGVAPLGRDLKAALDAADQALYAAKRGGRDQVVVAGAGQLSRTG